MANNSPPRLNSRGGVRKSSGPYASGKQAGSSSTQSSPARVTASKGGSASPNAPKQSHTPNELAVVSRGLTSSDFARGDIWSVPHHMPNLDDGVPHLWQSTRNRRQTCAGGVYSKYRNAVVLWKNERSMICAPITTFGDDGLAKYNAKGRAEKQELVEIVKAGGVHDRPLPLKAEEIETFLEKKSWVKLSESFCVDFDADVLKVGSLKSESRDVLWDLTVENMMAGKNK